MKAAALIINFLLLLLFSDTVLISILSNFIHSNINKTLRNDHLWSLRAFPLSDCRGQWISITQSSQSLQAPWKKKKKNTLVKQRYDQECIQSAGEPWKGGFSSRGFVRRHGRDASWEQSTPFYQYDTQNGHFKGRHERKMSAPAPSGSDHRGRRFIKIRAAVTVAEQWRKKKWVRWQTKIDPALLCAFSSPHPSLFSISRAPPGWRKWREATAERREEGQQGLEALAVWGRNRRALKAIYRPQGAGGGGVGQGTVRQTLG